MIDGLWVGAERISAQGLDRVEAALKLIKTHDPRRYRRILCDLDRVWIRLIFDNAVGQYNAALRACEIDERFVLDEAMTLEFIASVIVHEATHARLERCGIEYDEPLRQRIEAVCLRRELNFARKLPEGAQAEEWAQYSLDHLPDPKAGTFEESSTEGFTEAARYAGWPEWLIRGMLAFKRYCERRRSAIREAAQSAAQKPSRQRLIGSHAHMAAVANRGRSPRSYFTPSYFTPNSSTSKISVAFGGITPPAPRAP